MSCSGRLAWLLAAALAGQAAAEPAKGPSDDYAVLAYMHSVAWRMAARTCERGVQDYRVRFNAAYSAWEKRNAETLRRGDRLFQRAKNREWQGIPATRVEANEVARAEEELKRPPDEVGPLALDAEQRAGCDRLLADLSAGS